MGWLFSDSMNAKRFDVRPDGTIVADGEPISSPDGWVRLETIESLRAHNAPECVYVQLSLRRGADSTVSISGERVLFGGQLYPSVHAFAVRNGGGWIAFVHHAIAALFARPSRDSWEGARTLPAADAAFLVAARSPSADDTQRAPVAVA